MQPPQTAKWMQERPRVLIFAVRDWPDTAYLASRLAHSGFSVGALCSKKNALRHASKVDQHVHYSPWRPEASLRKAFRCFSPDLIVCGDDEAVHLLTELHARCCRLGSKHTLAMASVIESSLGNPASFEIIKKKSAFIRAAENLALRVPKTVAATSLEHLNNYCATSNCPVLLKCDRTYGGKGVALVRSIEDLEAAYRKVKAGLILRTLLRRLNFVGLLKSLSSAEITMQAYIDGCPANQAVVCWKGEVLAAVTVKAVETNPAPFGPATVVQLITHPEIDGMVQTVVRDLRLSGFCGFDFIIETKTNQAFLLEVNSRSTETSTLSRGSAPTLGDAIYRAMTMREPPARDDSAIYCREQEANDGAIVTFFPKEWVRCPGSSHLASPFHLVPWDEPELLAYVIGKVLRKRKIDRSIIGRIARKIGI